MLIASIIDTVWAKEQVYILMTDGKCEDSRQGPEVDKVCLVEYPDYTFWVYSSVFIVEPALPHD